MRPVDPGRTAIGNSHPTPTLDRAVVHSKASLLVPAPAEIVWTLLTDFEAWPTWNPTIQSVRRIDGPRCGPGTVFVWKSQGFRITSTLRAMRPSAALRWTGRAVGTHAVHDWILDPTEGGVLVTTEERFTGWLPRLMPGTMQDKLDKTLPRWLTTLSDAATTQATL